MRVERRSHQRPNPGNDLALMDIAADDLEREIAPDLLWIWLSPITGVEPTTHVAFADRSACEAANRFRRGRAMAFRRT